MPISYAGREFHEGKKITWRGRHHDAAPPSVRRTASAAGEAAPMTDVAAVVVNYNAGDPTSSTASAASEPTA